MMKKTTVMDTARAYKKNATGNILGELQLGGRFVLLDLALLATAILLILTDAKVLFFHVVFILLTFGAFYWQFRAFAVRAALWVTLTTVVVLTTILAGATQTEEIIEIPLLCTILVLVFAIARQRAQAEESLRETNEELESRVVARTAELTHVNAELIQEITRHKQTEESLRESEERYRRLVELSFEAIAIHASPPCAVQGGTPGRSQGKLLYVNPPGVKLLGALSLEDLIGQPILEFVHPDYSDLVQARLQQVGEERKGMPLVEVKLIRLDGKSVVVEIASVPITFQGQPAVHTVIHDITARKRAETARARERARIARDLHASLGHSLAYLHLKLDELASGDALGENAGVRQALAQMRDVANQAYEVVRRMLAASLPSNSTDLTTALLSEARSIGQRGKFKVQCTSKGQPRALSPVVQQQLLYLFQEALVNIEKHADARQVDIDLVWTEEALTISLSDDGRGFEADVPPSNGHFGLAIIQDRAHEINGRLQLSSSPDTGTELILRLPLDPATQPHALYES
jgi:PAS domain S-box-containing protein